MGNYQFILVKEWRLIYNARFEVYTKYLTGPKNVLLKCFVTLILFSGVFSASCIFAQENFLQQELIEAAPGEAPYTSNAKNLCQKIMLNESDVQIAREQRDYYLQERENVKMIW